MNVGIDGSQLMTPPAGTNPDLLPLQPVRTTGNAFINALPGPTTVRAPIANIKDQVTKWLARNAAPVIEIK